MSLATVGAFSVTDLQGELHLVVAGSNLDALGDDVLQSLNGGSTWERLGTPAGVGQIISVATATYQGQFTFDPGFPAVTDVGASTLLSGQTNTPATIYLTDGTNIYVTKDAGGPQTGTVWLQALHYRCGNDTGIDRAARGRSDR